MQFVFSPNYTPLGLEHGQCVVPTRLVTPHLAQVIQILSPNSLLISYAPKDTLHGISTMVRDSQVMILTRGHKYTLLILGVANPLLVTQLPSNTSNCTRSSPYEQPLKGNKECSLCTESSSKISLSTSSLRILAPLL